MSDEEVVEDGQNEEVEDDSLSTMLETAFDEAEGGDAADSPADEGVVAAAAPSDAPEGPEEGTGDAPDEKPPVGWGPELREQWAGLPEAVKQQVQQREQHMAQAMQGTAQARQIAQNFSNVANKYGSVMAAEGVSNPMQMVDTLLSTVSELRMGSPQQKAQKMAELIKHYGVDVSSLDDSLSAVLGGQPQQAQGQQVDPNTMHMIDQRMAPVNEMMQQLAGMQQQKNQQGQYAAQQEVETFSQNAEFLNDVRHDVADLIDMATRQGRDMPLQEAYDKACAMNPQIAGVLSQRAQQQSIANAGRNVSSKRAAASSLAPGNRGANVSPTPDTLVGQINAAWDEQLG